jgi:hypothetical protein
MLDIDKKINFHKDVVNLRKKIFILRFEIRDRRCKLDILEKELVELFKKLTKEVSSADEGMFRQHQ